MLQARERGICGVIEALKVHMTVGGFDALHLPLSRA
jgi:hypothetical protein